MKGDFGLMSRKTSICVIQVCIIKLVAYPWSIGLLFFVFWWFQGYFHCFVFWFWICNWTGSFVSLCVFLILLFFFWFVLCIYAFSPFIMGKLSQLQCCVSSLIRFLLAGDWVFPSYISEWDSSSLFTLHLHSL